MIFVVHKRHSQNVSVLCDILFLIYSAHNWFTSRLISRVRVIIIQNLYWGQFWIPKKKQQQIFIIVLLIVCIQIRNKFICKYYAMNFDALILHFKLIFFFILISAGQTSRYYQLAVMLAPTHFQEKYTINGWETKIKQHQKSIDTMI